MVDLGFLAVLDKPLARVLLLLVYRRQRALRLRFTRTAVLNLKTTNSQKCEAVPRRARIEGSQTFVGLRVIALGLRVIKQKREKSNRRARTAVERLKRL